MDVTEIAAVLQVSIAPVVLISGFGVLLLVMTNRIARPLDKLRSLSDRIKNTSGAEKASVCRQMSVLYKRARLLRTAIALNATGIFCVSSIILLLFATFILKFNFELIIQVLFLITIFCLMSSLLFFLADIRQALNSIKIEILPYIEK